MLFLLLLPVPPPLSDTHFIILFTNRLTSHLALAYWIRCCPGCDCDSGGRCGSGFVVEVSDTSRDCFGLLKRNLSMSLFLFFCFSLFISSMSLVCWLVSPSLSPTFFSLNLTPFSTRTFYILLYSFSFSPSSLPLLPIVASVPFFTK